MMADAIEARAAFDFVRYANCWEDADILVDALQPAPGKRLLSIASAGDNALALLAEGAEVVAADLNPSQLACVELRVAAIRHLEQPALLGFLGIVPADDRTATYQHLRRDLSDDARAFWDAQPEAIAGGIVHAGKFERYFQLFRRRILSLIHSRQRIDGLLAEKDREARHDFYEQTWDNRRWRLLFRLFFSRWMMGRLGRDPEFFRYVEGSVAERILSRTRYALKELPTHDNPYLAYILTGNYTTALPRYLRPEILPRVRKHLDHLTLHLGPIDQLDGPFDGFNLSDIFEYLDEPTSEAVYSRLVYHARPGARLAYWNMLVPRQCPPCCADRVKPLAELAEQLFARDKAWFYSRFLVDEVRP